jgi:hypothetical protein
MLVCRMTEQLAALIAQGPGLERASRLVTARIPVLPVFEELLPERGLRPGSMVCIGGIGATSLALSLISRASTESWTACVGMPELGLRAGAELGLDLDRLVVVPDPGKQWTDVLAALIDAFDVVLARAPGGLAHPPRASNARNTRKIAGRVRERDAVLVVVGAWPESDVRIEGTVTRWHGIGAGHGHLAARTVEVEVSGRRAAARGKSATLWLPDVDGEIRVASSEAKVASFPKIGRRIG